jgi:predicted nuclease of predicted toxin-antitoxin system
MKILFDQGTPVPLRRLLPGHEVDTAYELGWQELENGELIAAAEREAYEILITTDQNLRYEQNLAGRSLAVIVLLSTSWPRIRRHAETILNAIEVTLPGSYHEINIS